MSEEWGPWIEHDGKGCPVIKGETVETVFSQPFGEEVGQGVAGSGGGGSWAWRKIRYVGIVCYDESSAPIIRYRVRRPRALQQLIQVVENLPAPSKQYEDA